MQVGEFKKILEEYPDDMWLEFHVETEDREVYSYVNKGNYSHKIIQKRLLILSKI